LKNHETKNLMIFWFGKLRLSPYWNLSGPSGCGPFAAWLRCSSVTGLAPLPRRALPGCKIARRFSFPAFSTGC
jgi:hypothetical protein